MISVWTSGINSHYDDEEDNQLELSFVLIIVIMQLFTIMVASTCSHYITCLYMWCEQQSFWSIYDGDDDDDNDDTAAAADNDVTFGLMFKFLIDSLDLPKYFQYISAANIHRSFKYL